MRASGGVESPDVIASRADTECVWLPPLLERRMYDADRNRVLCYIPQTSTFEKFSEVALRRSGQERFPLSVTVDHSYRVPKRRQSAS
jgi:hypothetical protein